MNYSAVIPRRLKMDLEEMSKSLLLPNMDAQNVTAAVMNLIIQLGRESSIRLRPPTASGISYDDDFMNQEEDDTEELALNLSSILLSKYENDTAFLSALAKNLMNEEYRWKEEANRRLSDVSATALISIYVRNNHVNRINRTNSTNSLVI